MTASAMVAPAAAAARTVTRRIGIAADHPALAGHFPGRPILPGVSLVAEVLETIAGDAGLAAIVGAAPVLAVVKFVNGVQPGSSLEIVIRSGAAGVDFTVTDDRARLAASGRFAAARVAR